MNEVVIIDEIAKQLGMAADQVSGHIAELWPLYVSGMQTKYISLIVVVSVFGLVLPGIVYLLFIALNKKFRFTRHAIDSFNTISIGWVAVGIGCLFMACLFGLPYLINPEGTALINLVGMLKG